MAAHPLTRRRPRLPTDPLLVSAYSLMTNTVITSLLGVVFWIIAARVFPVAHVGVDATVISAAVTLSSVSQCNLNNALARFVPALRERTARAIVSSYAVNAAVAVVVGSAFVVIAPSVIGDLKFLRDQPAAAALFILAVALWGVFALQDAALVALRGAPWIILENGAFGVVKIAALPLLVTLTHGVALSWLIPMVVLLGPVNLLVFRRLVPRHAAAPPVDETLLHRLDRRGLMQFLGQDYLASIVSQVASTLVPLSVLAVLGADASAWFYVPFTMVVAFDTLFFNVATSLTVEGAFDEHRARELTLAAVRRFTLFLLPAVLALIVAAPWVLRLFGSDYAEHGTTVLRLLAATSVPMAFLSVAMAVARLQGRAGLILAMQSGALAVLLALLVPLEHAIGIDGVGLAWLVSHAAVALAVAPWFLRFLRPAPA